MKKSAIAVLALAAVSTMFGAPQTQTPAQHPAKTASQTSTTQKSHHSKKKHSNKKKDAGAATTPQQ